jgi:hypothetical protein
MPSASTVPTSHTDERDADSVASPALAYRIVRSETKMVGAEVADASAQAGAAFVITFC